MIGIIGAMRIEVEELIAVMTEKETTTVSGTLFTQGKLGGKDVVVARCGIGKVAAALVAEAMILHYAPELLINTGVGGALSDKLAVGDVVISSRAVEYDMDTSPIGDPIGFLSGIDRIYLDADENAAALLTKLAAPLGIHTLIGVVATGDRFISAAQDRANVLANFPEAAVCEMEGGAIAHTAFLNRTPFVIVRAVSDLANGSSPVSYAEFLPHAAAQSAALTQAFVAAW